MLMEQKALDVIPWNLDVVEMCQDGTGSSWHHLLPINPISDRFAEVIQRYSCDAYVNSYRREIKITISALVSLYDDYWKIE